jgi:DNA-binding transcriptional ArsR family regulator
MNVNDDDICQVRFVDEEKVRRLLKSLHSNEVVLELAETFRVLGDPTRLKICLFLSQAELCVCDLSVMLNVSKSAVSHQLRLLRSLRLVRYRRAGKMAFYTLDDEHVAALIAQALDHTKEKGR